MEFLAELFMEILGEIISTNVSDAVRDHRRPRWQRVLALSLIVLFLTAAAAVGALMAAAGVFMLFDGGPVGGVLVSALGAFVIVCCLYVIYKTLRTFFKK